MEYLEVDAGGAEQLDEAVGDSDDNAFIFDQQDSENHEHHLVAGSSVSSDTTHPFNRNPLGKNQHKDCVSKDDPRLRAWLLDYHRRNITKCDTISQLMLSEHGVVMSATTVKRRRRDFSIKASGATTRILKESDKRQLVLDQMAQDPNRRRGPRIVKEAIAISSGIHLTRDYISQEMKMQDPGGFEVRHPNHSKKGRQPLVVLGPHHEWSGDGHDKLSSIGFPIYGIRDVWSLYWLTLRVVPNNRYKDAIAYVWLSAVREQGGMCLQSTTDCGSETGLQYGFANALREHFAPHLSTDELPAHRFLKSVHNTTIERGWLRLRLQWGDNVISFWEAGMDLYDETNIKQYNLVRWLWPKVIQAELDQLRYKLNNHKSRKDSARVLPSGIAPQVALSTCDKLGGVNCLVPVDVSVIDELMVEIGGEDLVRFVPEIYEAHAQRIFNDLGLVKADLRLDKAWAIFRTMLPRI